MLCRFENVPETNPSDLPPGEGFHQLTGRSRTRFIGLSLCFFIRNTLVPDIVAIVISNVLS